MPKFRNRVPPTLIRQALSIDCSSSSPFLPNPQRPSSLNQPLASGSSNPNVKGGNYVKLRKGVHRTVTNASNTSEQCYNPGGSAEVCSPNSQSTSQAASTLSVDNSGSSEVTVKRQSTSHLSSGTVDLHQWNQFTNQPNGMVTLSVHTTGGMLGGSSTCLRTLSPHPSYNSQSDDSCSFDMGSVKSDNILYPKSPMKPYYKFRSESSFGRPTLVRQSKVDQTEIICIPDSDDEQQPIPEEEHESDNETG